MARISICQSQKIGTRKTHITSAVEAGGRRITSLAHSANAGHGVTISNRFDLANRHGTAVALEIDGFTAVVERAIVYAGLEVGLRRRLERCASHGLVAEDDPCALECIGVGLAVETFGAEIVGCDGAVVGTARGSSGQEISAFGCGLRTVAREIRDRGAVCTLVSDSVAVFEKGAVLDAPFEGVSVSR